MENGQTNEHETSITGEKVNFYVFLLFFKRRASRRRVSRLKMKIIVGEFLADLSSLENLVVAFFCMIARLYLIY